MRIVLAGAPDTGKLNLANAICKQYSLGLETGVVIPKTYVLGRQADYRVELKLASDRAFVSQQHKTQAWHHVYTHSLLDSVAYSTLRLLDFREKDATQYMIDKWIMTTGVIAAMMRDTFEHDHLLFLTGGDKEISEMLVTVMDSAELKYTILDQDKDVNFAKAKEVIAWTERT